MSKNIEKQVDAFYRELAPELELYSYGKPFYSIRKLMEKYRVSRHTVQYALERLEQEKRIVIKPTQGVFVAQQGSRAVKTIVHVHCDWPCEYWKNLDVLIEKEICNHVGYGFKKMLIDSTGFNYAKSIAEIEGDVILLTPPVLNFSAKVISEFLSFSKPIIFLQNQLLCNGINAIDLDPEYSGMQAAHHLISNGHRKIALILSEPWSMGDARRNSGFLNYAKINNVEVQIIDCKVTSGIASCSKTHEEVYNYLQNNGPTFTGCFTMSDYSAFGVISAVQEYGLSVPDDISVIGNGGISSGAHIEPALTTIADNIPAMVQAIIKGSQMLIKGEPLGIVKIQSQLVNRKSVKNITKGE